MNTDKNSIIDLGTWLAQPSGAYIMQWEQALLDRLTVDIFGFNALQIGLPQIDALSASRMPNKWRTNNVLVPLQENTIVITGNTQTEEKNSRSPIVVTHDFCELPFHSQSIDLVVLPHVLEFVAEPHQVLREVERILIPEGRVIICGFNRASLWGARQAAGRIGKSYFLPEEGDFISVPRMKDWLKLLNMEVNHADFGCYAPPFRTEKWLNRARLIENAGQRWWPYFGAVYAIQAIKRIKGMHLIGPAWKHKRAALGNAVPVANRSKKNG
ncbi:class I SAM-dependent methyltransferase [Undibacterium sp. RTI2.1]|uniref:class I SAM-dependent methyltransferase n=1 Tax=unclassified Undibacterium TaxID=2630295 RepID=UPI002AB56BC3|nr:MULTISPECIES: class I SAM-dependent methyltransferase [unclassified Undibacterium]MDY7536907.1 class I SAM-dependent methyltransferase [Undibacterium sp. 5I1]MEB0031663.1 class I SAM-dependent methyltransferase [Undibacterium sp. RTI2.1]MEB0117934.1 class I SAM-dependent methyltransferase [Undibacterium sp. RTI2.2]MEB0230412.1 class I SAM-dependent methyltransferase [Undibacterium sp. 10I3]MEB0258830.1 class I SAM-dependent methyltransferase [Undibacterium sp. 5I1]